MTSDEAARLIALADACEKAARPDRELDEAIRCVLFAPPGAFVAQSPINGVWIVYYGEDRAGRPRSFEWRGLTYAQRCGEFTASIDTAESLIPINHAWSLHWSLGFAVAGVEPDNAEGCVWSSTKAVTPALALTAAALRARASVRAPRT